ncbi:MAG: hypothetical protein WCF18_25895 [Chthoniobacteraceae bacterium]
MDPPQETPGGSLPVDSIAFADVKLRDLLHSTDDWAQKCIERRGRDECFRHDVVKLRLARVRVAELLLLVPPSDP